MAFGEYLPIQYTTIHTRTPLAMGRELIGRALRHSVFPVFLAHLCSDGYILFPSIAPIGEFTADIRERCSTILQQVQVGPVIPTEQSAKGQ